MKEILQSFYKVLENFKQEQSKKDKSSTLKLIEKITFLGGIYVSTNGFEILFKIPKSSIADDNIFLKNVQKILKLKV